MRAHGSAFVVLAAAAMAACSSAGAASHARPAAPLPQPPQAEMQTRVAAALAAVPMNPRSMRIVLEHVPKNHSGTARFAMAYDAAGNVSAEAHLSSGDDVNDRVVDNVDYELDGHVWKKVRGLHAVINAGVPMPLPIAQWFSSGGIQLVPSAVPGETDYRLKPPTPKPGTQPAFTQCEIALDARGRLIRMVATSGEEDAEATQTQTWEWDAHVDAVQAPPVS